MNRVFKDEGEKSNDEAISNGRGSKTQANVGAVRGEEYLINSN